MSDLFDARVIVVSWKSAGFVKNLWMVITGEELTK